MGMRRNNALPNNHFNKSNFHFKNWFNQPMKKLKRRNLRKEQENLTAPMPLKSLRPIVRCQSARYNFKEKYGKGFSMEELKAAEMTLRDALALNIKTDARRKEKSQETFNKNVARLNEFKSRITIFNNKREAIESGVKQ